MTNAVQIYTVSDVLRGVRLSLEDLFPSVWVEGEISNLLIHSSGHAYFSLKDAGGSLPSVLFRDDVRRLAFQPQNGQKVVANGRLSLYAPQGKFQLIARTLEPSGVGARQLALEQLKARLEKEGLFEEARKKPIPRVPQKIGVITSLHGAALRDILSVLNRRHSSIEVIILPTSVQGDGAAKEISDTIRLASRKFSDLDVLLVGRGGGSIEDLWAFNEEAVVRAIAECSIPIISCIGHEIDFTLADLVADKRAPTPSAAAEIVTKAKDELWATQRHLFQRLIQQIRYKVSCCQNELNDLVVQSVITRPQEWLEERMQRIDEFASRAQRAIESRLRQAEMSLEQASGKLDALSPLSVLGRGYSLVRKRPTKQLVSNAADVSAGEQIEVQCREGLIYAQVERTEI